MKKFSFIIYFLSIIILGVIGIWIGTYAYKINHIKVPVFQGMIDKSSNYELSRIVNSTEEIISPTATLVIKTFYNKCKHELKEYHQIASNYVNLNKAEFEQEFLKNNKNYIIENFSSSEITVSQILEKNCNQHYLLKTNNEYVMIYKLNESGQATEFKNTNISVQYLTETDKKALKNGIQIIGDAELNRKLEDYI